MQAAERLVVTQDFIHSVSRHEWERAERLYPDLGPMLTDDCLVALSQLHFHHERWAEAVDCLGQLKNPSPEHAMKIRLARNFHSLRQHRPMVYRTLVDVEIGNAYRIHPSPSGIPSLMARRSDGSEVLLAGGPDPQQAAQQLCHQLRPAFQTGSALAFLGIGDGCAFNTLVRQSPTLFLGRRQAIYLLEPDARLVFACLLLHDMTGPQGPIESQNVLWYVGQGWGERFRIDLLTTRTLPFPQISVKLGHHPQPIEQVLASTLTKLTNTDARCQQEIAAYYQPLTASDFSRAIRGQAGRPPRVLFLTTRFSTVLQHSTRDAAEAFRQLGWETYIIIEPASHHALSRVGIRQVLADFKPDLVFQIDHHRFEHSDLFPDNLPFVNWIQDLLPHLMTPETGKKLSFRDFVLTPSRQRWIEEYAYPPRQCMEFRKLTRIPSRPISWSGHSNRVTYVSNWSQLPSAIHQELLAGTSGSTRKVIDLTCQKMIAVYQSGHSLQTPGDVRQILLKTMQELGLTAEESVLRLTTTRLFDRMNNVLFRQQGLVWAKRACESLGLELRVYGTGWDKHPDFARCASGTIDYGPDLEELTRQSAINLVLEPFVCISHQRFLDAIVAGGFCLIRDNPVNHNIHSIIELIGAAGTPVENAVQLLEKLPQTYREQYDQTIQACDRADCSPGAVDHVAIVRALQQCNLLPEQGLMLPLWDRIVFGSYEDLHQKLARFTRDEELRVRIARVQRQYVEQRFSYQAGIQYVLRFIQDRLDHEPSSLPLAA